MASTAKKPLMRLLTLLLLTVWGAVAYQIVDTVSTMEEGSPTVGSRPVGLSSRTPYQYRADVPDPFTGRPADSGASRTVRKKPGTARVAWTPPPLQLTGILTHIKKATAVLTGPDGSTHFLSRGDTLLGARILKIRQGVVAYIYNRKKAEWVLE